MINIPLIYYHANYNCLPSPNTIELSFPVSLYFASNTSVKNCCSATVNGMCQAVRLKKTKAMEVVFGVYLVKNIKLANCDYKMCQIY